AWPASSWSAASRRVRRRRTLPTVLEESLDEAADAGVERLRQATAAALRGPAEGCPARLSTARREDATAEHGRRGPPGPCAPGARPRGASPATAPERGGAPGLAPCTTTSLC
ncbi:unnamed protein product, partial [Prorocentrum cordatum]